VITNFVAQPMRPDLHDDDSYEIRPVYYELAKAPLLGNLIAYCPNRRDADLICTALNDYMIKGQADA
jgi:hypothetical protein